MISRFYKNKRGVTLVEIIVVLAILAIVISSAYSLFSFGNQTFTSGNKQYNSQSSARLTSDYIIQEIRFVTSLSILSNPPVINVEPYSYLYIKDGSLYHDIYDPDPTTPAYNSRILQGVLLEDQPPFVNIDNSILGITIESKDGNQDYSLATEMDLPNLNLLSKSILGTTGKAISYSNDPSVPDLVPVPGPVPGATHVTVTFIVDKNNCSVSLIDIENGLRNGTASGSPAQNFIFHNIPINTTVQYTIKNKHGVIVKNNVDLEVEEEDMTVFTSVTE